MSTARLGNSEPGGTCAALPPLGASPAVSVVIPALNAASALPGALASVVTQDYPGVVDVVVAAGDEPTADAARRWSSGSGVVLRVVDNPSGRTPAALNRAIAAAAGEVVVRLDAHARLPAGYIARAVATLAATGAANVGGRQRPTGTSPFSSAVAAAIASPVGSGGAAWRSGQRAGAVDTVYLGCFRREALEWLDGFDERFVRSQDFELNRRIRAAGMTVWFDPSLVVDYTPRASVGALARQYFDYGVYKRALARLDRSSVSLRQLAPVALLAGLAAVTAVAVAFGLWWLPLLVVGPWVLALACAAVPARGAPTGAMMVALATMHLAWATGWLSARSRRVLEGERGGLD